MNLSITFECNCTVYTIHTQTAAHININIYIPYFYKLDICTLFSVMATLLMNENELLKCTVDLERRPPECP